MLRTSRSTAGKLSTPRPPLGTSTDLEPSVFLEVPPKDFPALMRRTCAPATFKTPFFLRELFLDLGTVRSPFPNVPNATFACTVSLPHTVWSHRYLGRFLHLSIRAMAKAESARYRPSSERSPGSAISGIRNSVPSVRDVVR
jgi:hypothetical protein